VDERLAEHLRLLGKYLDYLDGFALKPMDEFLKDITLRGAAERYLQLAIESCLNIGNRVLSLTYNDADLGAPENYADIFIKLGKLGIFTQEFVLNLVNMARFRNKLVHAYWEIEPERIYDILQNNVKDIHEFKQRIIGFLNANEIEKG
jgi:uncharacterized protein YutE (UPF0331/DUF86 family)